MFLTISWIKMENSRNICLTGDIWGMLSLHEASHLGAKDEEQLAQARGVYRDSHQTVVAASSWNPNCRSHVGRALELRRHLRMAKLEAIDEYSIAGKATRTRLLLS